MLDIDQFVDPHGLEREFNEQRVCAVGAGIGGDEGCVVTETYFPASSALGESYSECYRGVIERRFAFRGCSKGGGEVKSLDSD